MKGFVQWYVAFGVVFGMLGALVVGRLVPHGGPASASPGSQPAGAVSSGPLYTTKTVSLVSSPGGEPIAILTPATPLIVVAKQGTLIQVRLDLYRSPNSPTILYQDVTRLSRAGVLASPTAAQPTGTVTIAGSSWQRVRLVGWVPQAATSDDLNALWAQAASLYERSCGTCHSAHAAGEFTPRQWVSQFRAMVPRTSLTAEQADLILKWLQAHGSAQ